MTDTERTRSAGCAALSFLGGAIIGSGIALLTARKTGPEVRQSLKHGFSGMGEKARGYYDSAKEYVSDIPTKVKGMVGREESHVPV